MTNNVFYERVQSSAPTVLKVHHVYLLSTMTHCHLQSLGRLYTWTRKDIPHGKAVGQKRSFSVDRFPSWLIDPPKLQHKMPEFTSGWQLKICSRSDTRRIFSYFTIGFHRCNVVERYIVHITRARNAVVCMYSWSSQGCICIHIIQDPARFVPNFLEAYFSLNLKKFLP